MYKETQKSVIFLAALTINLDLPVKAVLAPLSERKLSLNPKLLILAGVFGIAFIAAFQKW